MSFETTGKLLKKFNTENRTETFRTREFILEIQDAKYPQLIKFQLVQDRCDVLDGFQESDEIKVFFDLRGREWQGKYFTNLQAWRIEQAGTQDASPTQEMGFDEAPLPTDEPKQVIEDDDLPF